MNNSNSENENIMKTRENELIKMLEELKHICFGMFANVIPGKVYSMDTEEIDYKVNRISDELTLYSVEVDKCSDKFSFYSAFYHTAIYYLLAMCNEEDQIFLSLRKLADTYWTDELVPIGNTTFDIMMNDVNFDVLNLRERIYAERCLQHYEVFKKYYEMYMVPKEFRTNIKTGVNFYVDKHKKSCIAREESFLDIAEIIKDASNKAYFELYQKLEINNEQY